MGLPIKQLVIATNKNDVLHKVMTGGVYARTELHHTLSPSMDISVSSNFERLLFDLYHRDGDKVRELMEQFNTQAITLDEKAMASARSLFSSAVADDSATCKTIYDVYEQTDYLLDPHSATGVYAARQLYPKKDIPVIVLATAHPAKFAEAITQSGVDTKPVLPHHMQDLMEKEERFSVIDNDRSQVNAFMKSELTE